MSFEPNEKPLRLAEWVADGGSIDWDALAPHIH